MTPRELTSLAETCSHRYLKHWSERHESMSRPPALPNVNSIASLLDRLVIEHLKRMDCIRVCNESGAATQGLVIQGVQALLIEALVGGFAEEGYHCLKEERTVVAENLLANLESLVISNLTAGVAERQKLTCLSNRESDHVMLCSLVALARLATERRAESKRGIDSAMELLTDGTNSTDSIT